MKKDKEWLKEELLRGLMKFNDNPNMTDYEIGIASGIRTAINLTEKLDEPETLSQEWIDENQVARINNVRKMTTSDVVTVEKLKNLLVPKQEKPVIPQFVVDWIERQKQPDWDYENKEDALADSIHFALYSLEANYPETNPDVVLRKPVHEWLDDDRKNYWKLIDGVRYGYEVEKEKKYRVKLTTSGSGVYMYRNEVGNIEFSTFKPQEFTEQEIKAIDERYWSFAEEVTE